MTRPKLQQQDSREREIFRLTQMIAAIEAGRFGENFPSVSMKVLTLTDLRARIADLRAGGPLPTRSSNGFEEMVRNARTYVQQSDGTYRPVKA